MKLDLNSVFFRFNLSLEVYLILAIRAKMIKKKKYQQEICDLFSEIKQKFIDKELIFKNRVKNLSFFGGKCTDYGKIQIVYPRDREEVNIYKEERIKYRSKELKSQEEKNYITSIFK